MARITVFKCDRCKRTVDESIEIHVRGDSFMDAAGSTDWHDHCWDLCAPCSQVVLNCIINKMPTDKRLKIRDYLINGRLEINY